MDPLKAAYGVKKPLDQKQHKISELHSNQKRYYPTSARGDVDEWGAVIQHRQEVYQREKAEEGLSKRLNQQDYHRQLDLAVAQKKEKNQVDSLQKVGEKDFMTRNLSDRATQDQQTLNNLNRQKTQFAEIARGLIDQKQH